MYYVILVIITCIQTILVNWMMGLSVFEISPYTIRLWSNYLAASLILWSPMLLTNKRRWTYVVALIFDIWFIGNLIYFRSYGDVLNRWCLLNASNLNGLWSSILPFLHWGDLSIVCLTLIWIIISETIHQEIFLPLWKRLGVAIVAFFILCLPHTLTHKKMPISPFNIYYADPSMGRMWYMHTYGAITHFANESINLLFRGDAEVIPVEEKEIAAFIQAPHSHLEQGNLLFVFFESLEHWVIGLQVNQKEVTPNINRLITHPQTGNYTMHAQVKEGKSSDAQLIAFNGLLPIRNGAASMRYASNAYSSFVKRSHAKNKLLFASYNYHIWNQQMNALAYGFDTLYAHDISDCSMADSVVSAITHSTSSFIYTMVTMASHTPFLEYADSSSLHITNTNYTTEKVRYLQCVHYTDSAIGRVIDTIMKDSVLASNTRIVIIGDHPIFDLETPIPFVIYDPFTPPVAITRPLYQIDIYTTLVDRMGIKTSWHGLGRNIADTCAYSTEEMQKLESLSDRIIRTNYFKK